MTDCADLNNLRHQRSIKIILTHINIFNGSSSASQTHRKNLIASAPSIIL